MPPTYPDPLTIPPLLSHKQTFILLHGRGSSGAQFGPQLLAAPITATTTTSTESPTTTLRDAFPHAKFVFPTASRRRARVFNRSVVNQWFDNWSPALDAHAPEETETETNTRERDELQITGLRESSEFVHDVVRREARLLDEDKDDDDDEDGEEGRRIVLGGLSQGCAMALVSLLVADDAELPATLGAVVGMCGWLPLRRRLEEGFAVGSTAGLLEGEEFNPFGGDTDTTSDGDEGEDGQTVAAYLRDQLDMPAPSSSQSMEKKKKKKSTPIFLGHGKDDEKVPVRRGEEAASSLKSLGATNVVWHAYEELGHWYSPEMLGDLVSFLKREMG